MMVLWERQLGLGGQISSLKYQFKPSSRDGNSKTKTPRRCLRIGTREAVGIAIVRVFRELKNPDLDSHRLLHFKWYLNYLRFLKTLIVGFEELQKSCWCQVTGNFMKPNTTSTGEKFKILSKVKKFADSKQKVLLKTLEKQAGQRCKHVLVEVETT